MSPRSSIYTALRTMDVGDVDPSSDQSSVWSTPVKQRLSPTISYASSSSLAGSPSYPYRSPSIPYTSPSSNRLLQTPIHGSSTSGIIHKPTKNRKHAAFTVTLVINVPRTERNVLPACLPTPNPSSPNFASRFRADVVQLVESSNIHKHSDTCYKYYNANRGDKMSCRMRMPRKLVPASSIDPATGHISMRRSSPWINNFNEYLISACRSNMDIKFIWSGSDAKALVYYITDYVTKMSLSFHDTFALIQKSITSSKDFTDETNGESIIERSRRLVLRCYNTLASQQELSGVQVASYLMNWDDHYTTHKFQGLYLIQTERYLQAELNQLHTNQDVEVASQGNVTALRPRIIQQSTCIQ